MTPEQIQEIAALASVIVAAVAVYVAWAARGVAKDANKISGDASRTAKEALIATRRQTALAAVPYLVVSQPEMRSNGDFMLKINNGGPTVAYGIVATIAAANSRSIDDVDKSTARSSGRVPALQPNNSEPLYRTVSGSTIVKFDPHAMPLYAWTYVRLEYHSPLGASVTHHYLWDGAVKWRLHRVRIDPGPDAGDVVQFNIELGPGDDDPHGLDASSSQL